MNSFKICILAILGMTFFSNNAFSQTNSPTAQVEAEKTISVKVKGVGCVQDLKTISANVEKIDGVTSCKTVKRGATTTFEIIMSPGLVTEDTIHEAIEDTPGCKNPNDRPYKVK